MAELLLEKETINHDDLVSLIGARPFKGHKSYLEFISANEDAKQKDAAEKEAEKEKDEEGDKGSAESDSGADNASDEEQKSGKEKEGRANAGTGSKEA